MTPRFGGWEVGMTWSVKEKATPEKRNCLDQRRRGKRLLRVLQVHSLKRIVADQHVFNMMIWITCCCQLVNIYNLGAQFVGGVLDRIPRPRSA